MKPRLHLVGIFHTQHTAAYSHCAFTGTFTADHLTELQGALVAGHLDGVYTLPAPES